MVTQWAKASLSSCLSSLCFTMLWLRPKFNPRIGQRPSVWKVSSVTCRRSVVSSGYSGFLHQKNWFFSQVQGRSIFLLSGHLSSFAGRISLSAHSGERLVLKILAIINHLSFTLLWNMSCLYFILSTWKNTLGSTIDSDFESDGMCDF